MQNLNLHMNKQSLTFLYVGAGLVGKGESILHLHKNLPYQNRTKVRSLCTDFSHYISLDSYFSMERSLFKLQLYGETGIRSESQARFELKKRPDAVVWIVDSQIERIEANLYNLYGDSHTEKERLRYGFEQTKGWNYCIEEDKEWFSQIPFVIQYNKRDLPNAAPIEELQKYFNPWGFPHFSAVATEGIGVMEPFEYCLEEIKKNVLAGKSSLGENWKDSALPITEKPTASNTADFG